MGGSRAGAGGAINKKKRSLVVRKNRNNMLNRKNLVEKQERAPQFTTKPLSKKKMRLILKRTGLGEFAGTHSRQVRKRQSGGMDVEDDEDDEPEAMEADKAPAAALSGIPPPKEPKQKKPKTPKAGDNIKSNWLAGGGSWRV